MNDKCDILIIAPHADDEALGCGGMIAKLSDNGYVIDTAIMTNAFVGNPEVFSRESIELVRNECLQSSELLGINNCHFFDFPAPKLDQYPMAEISDTLKELFHKIKPSKIFIPSYSDLHIDHKVIFHASLVASRPSTSKFIKEIYSYEVLSETNYQSTFLGKSFNPNKYIDISNYIDRKIEALMVYKSQISADKDKNFTRNIHAVKALAKYRGATINKKAAEAFYIERIIA